MGPETLEETAKGWVKVRDCRQIWKSIQGIYIFWVTLPQEIAARFGNQDKEYVSFA